MLDEEGEVEGSEPKLKPEPEISSNSNKILKLALAPGNDFFHARPAPVSANYHYQAPVPVSAFANDNFQPPSFSFCPNK